MIKVRNARKWCETPSLQMLLLRFRFLYAVLALIFATGTAMAAWEDQFTLRIWDVEQGLAGNEVRGILQDKDRFLWVATQKGVVRFDGRQFDTLRSPLLGTPNPAPVHMLIKDGQDSMLFVHERTRVMRLKDGVVSQHPISALLRPSQQIFALFSESKDVFWVVFDDQETWRWAQGKVEVFPAQEGGKPSWQTSFAISTDGKVYLARREGVEVYENGRLIPISPTPGGPATIHAARAGGLWLATAGDLYHWEEGALFPVVKLPAGGIGWPPTTMLETKDGALWLGIKGQGLFRWQSDALISVATSHRTILDLFEDDEGSIWAGTSLGLNQIRPARFVVLAEKKSDAISSVCEDRLGNIWLANSGGIWLVQKDGVEAAIKPEFWQTGARAICPDALGNVWCGAGHDLFHLKEGSKGPVERMESSTVGDVLSIYSARDQSVWVGAGGELLRFKDGTRQAFGRAEGFAGFPMAMAEDGGGSFWVGTSAGGLLRLEGQRLKPFKLQGNTANPPIMSLLSDTQGTLWIGTSSLGLFVRRDGKFFRIGSREGLPEVSLMDMLEDDFGRIWFSTDRGLFSVLRSELLDCAAGKRATVTPRIFGHSDGIRGFHSAANGQPGAWKGSDGRLWFASRNGVVMTNPAQGDQIPPNLRVHLDDFQVDDKATLAQSAALRSDSKKYEFQFTAPTFVNPEEVRFRYRLEGLDSDWVEVGGNRQATFSKLPPGNYSFEVAAAFHNEPWSAGGAKVSFEVLPFWWETRWARAGGMLLALVAAAGGVQFWLHRRYQKQLARIEQERRVELERARIARDLHDDLGSRLTEIAMLSELAQASIKAPERLGEHLDRIFTSAQGSTRALDEIVWAADPKHDRLDSFVEYLSNYFQKFVASAGLTLRVELPKSHPQTSLAAAERHHLFLAAKEVLNNAIKHSQAREISLRIAVDDGTFRLVVEDDGIGFDPSIPAESGSDGVANIQLRLAEIGGTVRITSAPKKGTKVELTCRLKG